MCRPKKSQKYVYSGRKRKHALKYQSVVAPDGIIIHLSGPFLGTRHDSFILQQSQLLEAASPYLTIDSKHYVFYGDPAYGQQDHVVVPFKGVSLSNDQQEFNKRMSKVRVCVKWGFSKVARYWAFLDYAQNQKLRWVKCMSWGTASKRTYLLIWMSNLNVVLSSTS